MPWELSIQAKRTVTVNYCEWFLAHRKCSINICCCNSHNKEKKMMIFSVTAGNRLIPKITVLRLGKKLQLDKHSWKYWPGSCCLFWLCSFLPEAAALHEDRHCHKSLFASPGKYPLPHLRADTDQEPNGIQYPSSPSLVTREFQLVFPLSKFHVVIEC